MHSIWASATRSSTGRRAASRIATLLVFLLLFAAPSESGGQAGRYLEIGAYLAAAFPAGVPEARTLWINGDLRKSIEPVLGHRFPVLRLRYWDDGERSAWIIDEIGKELPITIGVTVANHAIVNVRVLEFRESRGWEVRYPFFTDQFHEARLTPDRRLDRHIDGITGATLSVSAVKRIARVALIFHDYLRHSA